MPKKKGNNINTKSYSFSIPIVFNQIIEKFNDAGFVASKSEAVRCALSEWLLINIDLLDETFTKINKPKIEMSKSTKRLWKDVIKVINEHNKPFGGYEING